MSFDHVKDSGERTDFGTGSVRDTQEGKGRFDLLPFYPLERLAQHFENGAKKYGDNNWKLGQPLSQYVNSGMRHALKTAEGWIDEDHPAAAVWNFMALMWTKNEIDHGRLPAELDDIDWDEAVGQIAEIKTHDGAVVRTDVITESGVGADALPGHRFRVGDRVQHASRTDLGVVVAVPSQGSTSVDPWVDVIFDSSVRPLECSEANLALVATPPKPQQTRQPPPGHERD